MSSKAANLLVHVFFASHRGGKFKTYVLNSALQRALVSLADDFGLEKSIHNYLVENGHSDKRIYRVSDLRKFSQYARILGYVDDERFAPDDLKQFVLPRGWLAPYFLIESPVLPHGADMKLRNAKYILDNERYSSRILRPAATGSGPAWDAGKRWQPWSSRWNKGASGVWTQTSKATSTPYPIRA